MKKHHWSLLLLSLTLAGCSTGREFPPSRFIGLYGSWNGFPNGELPAQVENFTGRWQTNDGRIVGCYRDGVPTGRWAEYYPDGSIYNTAVYGPDGKFESISYFPDGMPLHLSRGHSRFAKSLQLQTSESIWWNFDGEIITTRKKSKIFKYPASHPEMVQQLEYSIGEDFLVSCWHMAYDQHFDLVLYLTPRQKTTESPARIRVTGTISEKGAAIQRVERFGNEKLQFTEAVRQNNRLSLFFSFGDAKDPKSEIVAILELN